MQVRVALCYDLDILKVPPQRLLRSDVIVFPELADGGYHALRRRKAPHREGDRFFSLLQTHTLNNHQYLVAGSTYFQPASGKPKNSSFVFWRGRTVHRYDKVHLFRACKDDIFFEPGESVSSFSLEIRGRRIRAGIIICYDLRFPELTRHLANQGLDILLVPARWPGIRNEAWKTLLRARAIENQVFVVGCNAKGKEGGNSYVFDPAGEQLLSSSGLSGSTLSTVDLPLDRLKTARLLHDNLKEATFLKGTSGHRP